MQKCPISCLTATDEKTHIVRYDKTHLIEKENTNHQTTVKQNISTPFRLLPETLEDEPEFFDPQFQRDFTGKKIFPMKKSWNLRTIIKNQQKKIEDDDIITDSHVSDKLRFALVLLWTIEVPNTSPLPKLRPRPISTKCNNRS